MLEIVIFRVFAYCLLPSFWFSVACFPSSDPCTNANNIIFRGGIKPQQIILNLLKLIDQGIHGSDNSSLFFWACNQTVSSRFCTLILCHLKYLMILRWNNPCVTTLTKINASAYLCNKCEHCAVRLGCFSLKLEESSSVFLDMCMGLRRNTGNFMYHLKCIWLCACNGKMPNIQTQTTPFSFPWCLKWPWFMYVCSLPPLKYCVVVAVFFYSHSVSHIPGQFQLHAALATKWKTNINKGKAFSSTIKIVNTSYIVILFVRFLHNWGRETKVFSDIVSIFYFIPI